MNADNEKRTRVLVIGVTMLLLAMMISPMTTASDRWWTVDDNLLDYNLHDDEDDDDNTGDNECSGQDESCIVTYDIDRMRERVREGHLELMLFEKDYVLELETINREDFESGEEEKGDFDAGIGRVVNELENDAQENSTAFIVVGLEGVAGFIQTREMVISFTPYSEVDSEAEPGETMITQNANDADGGTGREEEGDEVGVLHHWYDVNLIVMVDQEFIDRHNFPVTWARDVIHETNRVFARASDEHQHLEVPQFAIWGNTIWLCNVCTSTTATTLVTQFGDYVASLCKGSWDCEDDERIAAHLLTGKRLDSGSTGGKADLPGRYGVSLAVDTWWTTSSNIQYYKGGSVKEEAAQLVAHELGHNFAGEHADANTWTEENHPACTHGPVHGPDNSNQYFGCAWNEPRFPEGWEWSWAIGCSNAQLVSIGNRVIGYCNSYIPWLSNHATIMQDGHYQNPKEDANHPNQVFYTEYEFSHANRIHIHNCINSGSSGGAWQQWEQLPLEPSNGPYDNKCTWQHTQ